MRRFLVLGALIAFCATPGTAHAWMTKPLAEKYARDVASVEFGSRTVLASGARSRCRFVGTMLGNYRVFRCAFRVRFKGFRYHGSARVYPYRVEGNSKTLYSLSYRWYRGACGEFPGGSPHPGPYP